MKKFILKHKYELLLGFFILLYIFYYTIASFLRYDNFYTGRFDLGNMDQTVWNTIHGRIFEFTNPNGTENVSRLAFHADFILILLSPLYLIWESPKMLLLIQTLVLSIGAIFIYLIGKEVIKNKNISLSLAFVYLINPAVGYTNLYDFHPVTLATTFLLASFYFILKKNYKFFLLFALLSGLTKEHVWAIVALLGLYIIFIAIKENGFRIKNINKDITIGLVVFFSSAFTFYYLIWHAIPNQAGGNHFALSYYSDFGNSASEVAKNILFDPLKTLSIAFAPQQINYLMQILAPLGFLPLISPLTLLISIPDLAVNLLSNNAQLHQIYYQYTSTTTPFLFISLIYSSYFLLKRFPNLKRALVIYILFFAFFAQYQLGPLPYSKKPNIDMFTKKLVNKKEVETFISKIPEKSSVATTNNLGSHLSQRQIIYTIPIGLNNADYVLFLLNDWSAQPSLDEQKQMAKKLKINPDYMQIYKQDDFVVFAKKKD